MRGREEQQLLDRLALPRQRLGNFGKGAVDHQDAILRMVDDPGEVMLAEPRIERVANRPDARDRIPGDQMRRAVHRQGRNQVAGLYAIGAQVSAPRLACQRCAIMASPMPREPTLCIPGPRSAVR